MAPCVSNISRNTRPGACPIDVTANHQSTEWPCVTHTTLTKEARAGYAKPTLGRKEAYPYTTSGLYTTQPHHDKPDCARHVVVCEASILLTCLTLVHGSRKMTHGAAVAGCTGLIGGARRPTNCKMSVTFVYHKNLSSARPPLDVGLGRRHDRNVPSRTRCRPYAHAFTLNTLQSAVFSQSLVLPIGFPRSQDQGRRDALSETNYLPTGARRRTGRRAFRSPGVGQVASRARQTGPALVPIYVPRIRQESSQLHVVP
ncbi:hypothetical protein Bbelb_420930 [Branchiostoma belcheri]|nr:hypothetical protein Bbelb_420930 [Branchiostoma belcheri]